MYCSLHPLQNSTEGCLGPLAKPNCHWLQLEQEKDLGLEKVAALHCNAGTGRDTPLCLWLTKRLSCCSWSCEGNLIPYNNSLVLRSIHGPGDKRKWKPLPRAFISTPVLCFSPSPTSFPAWSLQHYSAWAVCRDVTTRGVLGKPAETS